MFIFVQAFKNHEIVDVFHQPGNSDLTANVDFAYLREAMSDLGILFLFPTTPLLIFINSKHLRSHNPRFIPRKNGPSTPSRWPIESC